MQMTDERYLISHPTEELSKTTVVPYGILRMANVQNDRNAEEDVKSWELSRLWAEARCGCWSTKYCSHFGRRFYIFLNKALQTLGEKLF